MYLTYMEWRIGKVVSYQVWIVIIHLAFWAFIGGLALMIFYSSLQSWAVAQLAAAVTIGGLSLLVYGHLLFLIPRFFNQQRYISYGVGLLSLLVGTALLRFYVGWGLVKAFSVGASVEARFTPNLLGAFFIGGVFLVVITIPLRLIANWFKKRELEQELKTHKLEAELRFLKAQVNPHFLFNALNNIYSLSFTQSEKAPEMILKLSDMMSYMLYDCKGDLVALTAEIQYLRNYIDLQQLKKDGELDVQFHTAGNLSSVHITPMLFIPFFENAFKHGNLDDIGRGWLKGELSVEDQILHFSLQNSVPTTPSNHPKGGVGLENIRERLRLIYGERHELSIREADNCFEVSLTLHLMQPTPSIPEP